MSSDIENVITTKSSKTTPVLQQIMTRLTFTVLVSKSVLVFTFHISNKGQKVIMNTPITNRIFIEVPSIISGPITPRKVTVVWTNGRTTSKFGRST